jgi:hypothetical protein
MEPRETNHDTGAKTLFNGVVLPAGQSATADIDAVMDAVFNHPNVPPFIATRLIRSLVTSNPSPAYIQRVANVFVNNGQGVRGDLAAVLVAILTDPEAFAFNANDGRLKDPILHVIGLGRALGAQIGDPGGFMYVFGNLSQQVLTPTTVFSFYSPLASLPGYPELYGPEFQIYPPALALQRANFIYGLLNNQFSSAFRVDLAPFAALATSPSALADGVNERLMHGRMSTELRDIIITATTAVPVASANQRALGALYLAAISSEYSVFVSPAGPGASVTTAQPPTGVSAISIAGNQVTLRWNPPVFGPAPDGYVMEAGVRSGEVLASIPTGSAAPTFSFNAPPGSFYLRIHSISGGQRSTASTELRIHVNTAAAPSAPNNLLGMVNGSNLALSWRNTFAGGTPTAVVLDVSGPVSASLPLGVTDTFTFAGVPPGEYTFSVRAVNATGSSGPSNEVTLTFPTACSGAPQVPTNVIAHNVGSALSVTWHPPSIGAAPTSYLVNATGAYVGSVPITGRSVTANVPPGTYNLSVTAVNPCGASAPSPVRTVRIP